MSPVVFMWPVTIRSDDSVDGAGFALGAAGVAGAAGAADLPPDDDGGVLGGAGGVPGFAGAASPPSGLFLENISSCLYVGQRVHRLATQANLVMEMDASAAPCGPHIADMIAAGNPVTDLYMKFI